MLNIDAEKIESYKIFLIGSVVVGMGLGPLCYIFTFANNTFLKIETWKLIFLSCAIGFPAMLVNMHISWNFFSINSLLNNENVGFEIANGAGYICMLLFYLPIIIDLFEPISLKFALTLSGGIQLLFIVIGAILGIINSFARKE